MASPPKTKILFISPLPPATGGISSWMQRIVEHGLHDDYVIHIVDTSIRNKTRAHGVSLWTSEGYRTVRILTSFVLQLIFIRPHIIHLNCSLSPRGVFRDLICALLARLWGVPVVGHYRGNIPDFAGGRWSGICWWALRQLIKVATLNIAMNRGSLEYLYDLQREKQHSPVSLPNVIQDSVFHRRFSRVPAPARRIRVLYAGWINMAKGCHLILSVARKLPEIDFMMLGPVMSDMEHHLNRLPENVTMGGDIATDAVFRHMETSDVFLFPSRHAEGFPNAVLEAMAAGLPVVTTKVGALPEMIEEGKGGLFVDGCDADGIASALQVLIANPEMRDRMGRFNIRKSETEYACSVVADRLISLYRHVLSEA